MNSIPNRGEFLGHPKGLFLLFGTEMWERFGYYGMRAILVLYLVAQVQNGGFGWTNADALSLYGTFTMAVYLTPLFGGWLADNVLGQRKAIIIGGILMAAGHFIMGIPHSVIAGQEENVFYVGLTLLCIGNGLFKPNISTMVGDLYEDGDKRRDGAFTIFYMGINLGGALGPLVAGYVASEINWQAGFVAAGIGMVISVIMQMLLSKKYLGDIGVIPSAKLSQQQSESGKKEPLTQVEKDRIRVIFTMSVFSIIFWMGFEQAGGLMNLFANDYTDRMLMGFEIPASWFQSLNSIFIIIFAPIVAMIWLKLDKREPNSPVKFAIGLVFLALGFLTMMFALMTEGAAHGGTLQISMMWLVLFYLFHTLGELCLSPIGLSMVSKLAPLRLASLLMGIWFLCTAVANKIAGFVGSFIGEGQEAMGNAMGIFIGLGATALLSALAMYLLSNKLVDWMHGAEGDNEPHTQAHYLEKELEVTGERQ
ncbi:peptide MFS transporter [Pseudoalteromonas luteoviolacea]|uniref:DeoR family transcriptional regulator n=1 Tax=Pseudoalteromonas luteoviolacea S4054 TaxID=1129367 RepID=A0A0F6AAV4_9GAMM|nr:peptide MFS transporter [Pseudoalteromonas luteoviolacea]AOT07399.1 dipeptide/tripeptide permease [Pseudoalteromonas luteoviolacea]AOT12315.1 dipeptide/tripeptide permease [Pseudoalteromonas luteoviolacea]AOT17228.1 dipeptide/tripeptide permease [Pseudoalteromonas luteoviolacea]KKE82971.1 DeoR family transcriptional regulator [Pseudoalteromonas luteoviolacea S4054]KZN72318.1 DeoR family transcriptional regulator [Pseudoalteromonas luteoviolacea S4047-1]